MPPLTLAATAAWARRLPIASATLRGRVPSGTCLVEPSGSRRVSIVVSCQLSVGRGSRKHLPRTTDNLLAHVGQKGHEAGAFDRVLDRTLEGCTIAAAFAAEQLALAGTEFLQALYVLVIDEGRPGTAFLGAESAAVFPP